jgi:cytochrome P450
MSNAPTSSAGPDSTEDVAFPTLEIARCPFGTYAKLREDDPVHPVPGRDEYLVTRYADIVYILRNPDIFSSVTYVLENGARRPATPADLSARDDRSVATFQGSDRPAHTWKRKLSSAHFRPGQVREYEPLIRQTVDELIDRFSGETEIDFIASFARPLGAITTMLIVGLPVEDAQLAEAWMRYDGQGTPYHSSARQAEIAAQVREMQSYIGDALRSRHAGPRDDVLSRFVASHVEKNGEELGLEHAIQDCFSVMLGGVGTSSHMLGNAMLAFLSHPHVVPALRADAKLRENAIEEALRLEAPVQWNLRMVRQDVELSGTTIPAGAYVLMLYGAGNRDEAQFHDAATFHADRENARTHLAFGHGLHFCLGAPLARLQSSIAFERLFARIPEITLAGPNPFERVESLAFWGLQHLDLKLGWETN